MLNIPQIISDELKIQFIRIKNAILLRAEGGTIPFIARYRKERTDGLDENQLRDIFDRYDYLEELEKRKITILETIEKQGKLTDELKKKIEATKDKTILEDLYLPYKPKKRSRATQAREKGLEPLSIYIKAKNMDNSNDVNLSTEAKKFINAEKEVNSEEEALKGASDILAEEIAETLKYREHIRKFLRNYGVFKAKVKDEFEEGTTKYETYRNFSIPVSKILSHTMLALRRGENEEILTLDLDFEKELLMDYFKREVIISDNIDIIALYEKINNDAFERLMKNSIIGEIRLDSKKQADLKSIDVFEKNLRNILLSAPAGMKPTLAVDPGFRTGCKTVVIDETGKFIEYEQIFPFASKNQIERAKKYIINTVKKSKIELIAVGNGTAGRETEQFVNTIIADLDVKPIVISVNESGASIYSASKIANEEFPDLDLTVRGAISIGRRLQDPLAELVKIDPKSIGVGQYQHDVDQKLLKKKLQETVESCVNYVGVNLNTASKDLLTYISGITAKSAENIVKYRDENGVIKNRKQLLKVSAFGKKAYELSAGFLRIPAGENILDNTAVHPESYHIVEQMAKDLKISLNNFGEFQKAVPKIDIKKYISDEVGEPTLIDIVQELLKPGRDPREKFITAQFDEKVTTPEDLKTDMLLEGIITNVTNFGAFVDIGVHQDGLVHKSQMAFRYVSDPTQIVKVGQIVKVKVVNVDLKLKRIQLSMKIEKPVEKKSVKAKREAKPVASLEDLKSKFGR